MISRAKIRARSLGYVDGDLAEAFGRCERGSLERARYTRIQQDWNMSRGDRAATEEIRQRLHGAMRVYPTLGLRILEEMAVRPWLSPPFDPALDFLLSTRTLSFDMKIVLGRAINHWPNWLLFPEGFVPAAAAFHRWFIVAAAELDPKVTGDIRTYLFDRLNEDDIATRQEVDSWLVGTAVPRPGLREALAEALEVDLKALKSAADGPQALPPDDDIALDRAEPITGTERYPVLHARLGPRNPSSFLHRFPEGLNAIRTQRLLEEASHVMPDNRIVGRWMSGELNPSPLEVLIVNKGSALGEDKARQYRCEIEMARNLIALSSQVMIRRGKASLNFLERLAVAMHVADIVPLSANRSARRAALDTMGVDADRPWLNEDILPDEVSLSALQRGTGVDGIWFIEGIASRHSILA